MYKSEQEGAVKVPTQLGMCKKNSPPQCWLVCEHSVPTQLQLMVLTAMTVGTYLEMEWNCKKSFWGGGGSIGSKLETRLHYYFSQTKTIGAD